MSSVSEALQRSVSWGLEINTKEQSGELEWGANLQTAKGIGVFFLKKIATSYLQRSTLVQKRMPLRDVQRSSEWALVLLKHIATQEGKFGQ